MIDGIDSVRSDGHELLRDDGAVFGLPDDDDLDPPGWLWEPAEVRRRIAAKVPDDGLSPPQWAAVAGLAVACAELARDDRGPDERGLLVSFGVGLGAVLAARLPRPPVPLLDGPGSAPAIDDLVEDALLTADDADLAGIEAAARELRSAGLVDPGPTDWLLPALRTTVRRLAETIDARSWTDPDVVAGLVDDVRRLLARLPDPDVARLPDPDVARPRLLARHARPVRRRPPGVRPASRPR